MRANRESRAKVSIAEHPVATDIFRPKKKTFGAVETSILRVAQRTQVLQAEMSDIESRMEYVGQMLRQSVASLRRI